jgi:hypothetical protein
MAPATEQQDEHEGYVIQDALRLSKTILSCPGPVDISQVAFYPDQKGRIDHITGIITASHDLETRSKDIGNMTSTAVGTYAVDLTVFGGLPVTPG